MMPEEKSLSAGQAFPGPDGDGMPPAEELFGTRPAASPADIRAGLLSAMGEDVPRPQRPPDHPDVHGLAEQLGLA